MRKVILVSVLAIVAGAGLWHLLQYDTGYVLVVVAGKTIEMRLVFALLCVLLFLWLLGVLWRFVRGTGSFMRLGWGAAARRRALKAELRTQRGLLSFIEGDWQSAEENLLKAARKQDKPLVQYLAAAHSAHQLGQFDKAQELLNKAQAVSPSHSHLISLSRAQMLLDKGQYESSLATLHRVKTALPSHPLVLNLLKKVYVAMGDWPAAELLLPQLRAHKVLPENEIQKLEQQTYAGLLNQTGKKLREENKSAVLEELEEIWKRIPKINRKQPELVLIYARYLVLAGAHDAAEALIRQALKEQWFPALVELYGLASPTDRQSQLHYAQRWEQEHADDHELHLALGRISLRNELWGQARDHFLTSLRLHPTPAAYAELGRLLAHLGEPQQSSDYYQRGLLLVTHGLPGLPMPGG
ncbi:hypothetical protein DWB84_01600 [Saccharophagus sp. K07]|uniref:heme biosynthesis HemY N-terminal domain-containing protein n=1 Tax=Saccharophagus sp. K07 TaxID=2283636 RepID=UPI0016520921|nr:heme biosynthesis HemY N-terminal domain-containing protein [Saccharophagus sp. K07]MBC6904166.1 hypothetical protein [Saccharophagus sp. K07]